MARKKAPEEHENHERWLVSYADFITLLFAFFVVMYSISSVNEGKYRVLSDALVAAFRSSPKSLTPIQVGSPSKSPVVSTAQEDLRSPGMVKLPKMFISQNKNQEGQVRDPLKDEQYQDGDDLVALKKIADDVKDALAALVAEGLITVKQSALWVEVEINNSVLFPSGSARLQAQAVPVLKELAQVLSEHENSIRVEGFTDNLPINTVVYPSNWELSAARASSVVRLFMKNHIAPGRMVAQGYGEYRPVADNDTPEGRSKNRRVVIVVLADKLVEQLLYDYGHGAEPDQAAPADDVADSSAQHEMTAEETLNPHAMDEAPANNEQPAAQPADAPSEVDDRTSRMEKNTPHRQTPLEVPAAAPNGPIAPDIKLVSPLGLAPFRLTSPIRMRSPDDQPAQVESSRPHEPEAGLDTADTVSDITRFE